MTHVTLRLHLKPPKIVDPNLNARNFLDLQKSLKMTDPNLAVKVSSRRPKNLRKRVEDIRGEDL